MGKVDATYLRKELQPGTRIELVAMDDPQAPPAGCRGTVRGIDDAGNILVEWDTGSRLSLIPEVDKFKRV